MLLVLSLIVNSSYIDTINTIICIINGIRDSHKLIVPLKAV